MSRETTKQDYTITRTSITSSTVIVGEDKPERRDLGKCFTSPEEKTCSVTDRRLPDKMIRKKDINDSTLLPTFRTYQDFNPIFFLFLKSSSSLYPRVKLLTKFDSRNPPAYLDLIV